MRRAATVFAISLVLGACTLPPPETETSGTPSSSSSPGSSDGGGSSDDGGADDGGSDGEGTTDSSGVALSPSDVLTIASPSMSPEGTYGTARVEAAEDTITSSFTLKDGTQIYSVPRMLRGSERVQIERAAQDYVNWIEEGGTSSCPHSAPSTVTISGSLTHESSAVGCETGTPLWSLEELTRDIRDTAVGELAHPFDTWTIEIMPWGADGPDRSVPAERYTLLDSGHEDEMSLRAENATTGWGKHLAPGTEPGAMTFTPGGTGEALTALNTALLADDLGGCQEPTAQVTIIKSGSPGLIWTPRLCPGQDLVTVTEMLRGL